LRESGVTVTYAAFSTAAKSVPEGFPKDVLKHEVRAATSLLGSTKAPSQDLRLRGSHLPAAGARRSSKR